MEEIPKKTRITKAEDTEEQEELSAHEIRDKIVHLQSQLSRDNLLKNYRKKLLEALEKGELNDEEDELVNSEDLMQEEGEEEDEQSQGAEEGEEEDEDGEGEEEQGSNHKKSTEETKKLSFEEIMQNVQSQLVGKDIQSIS